MAVSLARVVVIPRPRSAPQRAKRGTRKPQRTPRRVQEQAVVCRSSGEEFENKFAPLHDEGGEGLGGTSDEPFGPLKVMLAGFRPDEVKQVRQLLDDMDAYFVKMSVVTPEMRRMRQGEALEVEQERPERQETDASCPRVCFLSGMTPEEALSVIDGFREAGLEQPLFAGVVPNSYEKSMEEIFDEVLADYEEARRKQQGSFSP